MAKRFRGRGVVARISLALIGLTGVGCWSGTPYPTTKIDGVIEYRDGSRIPADHLMLRLLPLAEAKDPRTTPRTAIVNIDVETGEFVDCTTYKYDDGAIRGRHRVIVRAEKAGAPAYDLVPRECFSADETPLIVDTAETPVRVLIDPPGS